MSWQLGSAGNGAVSGVFWRMLAPRWSFDPLSGAGAARVGGRWNEPGQPALYLSDTHGVAIAEYQQDLPRPGTLTGYHVDAASILDLVEPSVRQSVGLDATFLKQAWKRDRDIKRQRPACWDFVRQAADLGWNGLRAPSAQTRGNNLVLWQWNVPGGANVRIIDPMRDLPQNPSSWVQSA